MSHTPDCNMNYPVDEAILMYLSQYLLCVYNDLLIHNNLLGTLVITGMNCIRKVAS